MHTQHLQQRYRPAAVADPRSPARHRGCGTENGTESVPVPSAPAGRSPAAQWNVESVTVDGKTRDAPAGAHIEFGKDGKVGGNFGCNRFGATPR